MIASNDYDGVLAADIRFRPALSANGPIRSDADRLIVVEPRWSDGRNWSFRASDGRKALTLIQNRERSETGSTLMAASSDFDRVLPAGTGPAPRDLKKAIDYMRRNMSRRIATADLDAACGVAERTLRKHFRAFVGLAPLEYLRRLRLAAVREDLLNRATGASVTEVATRYGFSHFGRFSSLYRRYFGEAPSSTLARGRAEVESDKAGRGETLSGSLRLSREKPSLAVLPCQVSRAESGHRFFAQSIAEGIATALCRARSISVQGPHPSRSAASHDPQRLVRYLGVRYVLIGRMAENAGRIRIIMRLLEVATNTQIWGDSYDGEAGHLFALQDRVTEGVVKAILPGIRGAEIE